MAGLLGIPQGRAAPTSPLLDPRAACRERLAFGCSRTAGAGRMLLTQDALAGAIARANLGATLRVLVVLDDAGRARARHRVFGPRHRGAWRDADRPEQLAYVIYTSGSTGAAKGVMVEDIAPGRAQPLAMGRLERTIFAGRELAARIARVAH